MLLMATTTTTTTTTVVVTGDGLFTSTLVAAVEVLCGHFATYLDLPAYIRKWMPGSREERRVRFSNNMLTVVCLGSVGLCMCC